MAGNMPFTGSFFACHFSSNIISSEKIFPPPHSTAQSRAEPLFYDNFYDILSFFRVFICLLILSLDECAFCPAAESFREFLLIFLAQVHAMIDTT